ncbi:MAG: sigma 54-interacting transcriptional regulator [Bdellovibrionales bacterium]|nr:sigma 54-interacting transcriptional regulator [Bdellovibrionales bacterium]
MGVSYSLRLLLVDSNPVSHKNLLTMIESQGLSVSSVSSLNEAQERLESEDFELVLFELSDVEKRTRDFISKIFEENPSMIAVGLLNHSDRDLALQSFDLGVYECIPRSIQSSEFERMLVQWVELAELRAQVKLLTQVDRNEHGAPKIIGNSVEMNRIMALIKKIADYKTTCLIEGESGTGKELIAQMIHQSSSRSSEKFIAINCGAIPENLLESELFGYVKGAFTGAEKDRKGIFEEVNHGTLFLDEIGEMPLALQAKILRVLQEDEIRRVGSVASISIDVRIIAASLKDLAQEVKVGRFREDLFYRLNVLPIAIPPLRERKEDIPELVDFFVGKENQKLRMKVRGLDLDAMSAVISYDWPGNVRELENAIERAMILTTEEWIGVEHLPNFVHNVFLHKRRRVTDPDPEEEDTLSIKEKTRTMEIDLISKALEVTKGNRTRAAKILEISHRSLLYKIKEYGLVDVFPASGRPRSFTEE